MKYIRTKDGIISSAIATHELTESICDYGYLKTLGAGSLVRIGKTWSNCYGRFTSLYDVNGCCYDIRPDKVEEVVKKLPCADTIEELCEGFLVEEKDNEDNWFIMSTSEFKNMKLEDKQLMAKYWNHYGYIKTDKGLIYVTKPMNEKGELELL